MPVEIRVPNAGESVTEAIVARWLKADGDYVRADEPVVELETDKATQEVPAPAAGKLVASAQVGATVAVGSIIGRIEEAAAPAFLPARSASEGDPAAKASLPPSKPPSQPQPEAALSPSARVRVESRGLDPRPMSGSGRGGRIIKQDLVPMTPPATGNGMPAPPAPVAKVTDATRETRERMSGLRQRIAVRLVESQQSTASLTTFNEADLHAVNDLRSKYKERFKEKHGVGLGYTSFFVKAAIEALKAFPIVNARIDGTEIVMQHFHDIGVAVSTERGLMVPIVRDADRLSFADIERKVSELAVKARDGKIAVSDLQGGTFTITNGGIFGSLLSTPILNPPQTAILGMHAIQKRPVVVNDQIVIRPMMYLALTYDHRLIDGREAVQFLVRIKEGIENPERLMLEI